MEIMQKIFSHLFVFSEADFVPLPVYTIPVTGGDIHPQAAELSESYHFRRTGRNGNYLPTENAADPPR